MRTAAPRRLLNPRLLQQVASSNINKHAIALVAGWPYYVQFYATLRSERVAATALTVKRLMKVAEIVKFGGEVFLDEPEKARQVKRDGSLSEAAE